MTDMECVQIDQSAGASPNMIHEWEEIPPATTAERSYSTERCPRCGLMRLRYGGKPAAVFTYYRHEDMDLVTRPAALEEPDG